jgi:hypothetical protein
MVVQQGICCNGRNWTDVVARLIGEQRPGSDTDGYPWHLRPITSAAATQAIQVVAPGAEGYATLQRLCDMYVLERDGLVYHVAYPSAPLCSASLAER